MEACSGMGQTVECRGGEVQGRLLVFVGVGGVGRVGGGWVAG